MIPKKIHYCWFGRNPLSKQAKKCIQSWKRYCPEYEIVEWNEVNFNINCCRYVREAYDAKKWAFVSDYARFLILYEQGGVYLDVDVELVQSLDELLMLGAFMGCEDNGIVAPGLGLAVEPGHRLYKELLDGYMDRSFYMADETMDLTTVVTYTTEILKKYGLKEVEDMQQIEGIFIYPKEFFCPKNPVTREIHITDKTVAIHHYDGSWLAKDRRFVQRVTDLFGYKVTKVLIRIKHFLRGGNR